MIVLNIMKGKGSKYYVFNIGVKNRVKIFREKTQENLGMKTWIHKNVSEMNVTKVISKNVLVKSLENIFIFFTCILPDYVVRESSNFVWKISHFENKRKQKVFDLCCSF